MKRFSRAKYLLCLVSLTGIISALAGGHLALAAPEIADPPPAPLPNQEEVTAEAPVAESLEIVSRFPVKQGASGTVFEFEVDITYQGNEPKVFDFTTEPPDGWQVAVHRYTTTEEAQPSILAMTIENDLLYAQTLIVELSPLPGNEPEPGDYTVTFEAASGSLKDSVELKAVVTELPLTYEIGFTTISGRLDFAVKPGEDNSILLEVTNSGTGDLTDFSFTSVKSEGWGAVFTPNRIDILKPGESVEAEVIMTPPRNTVAGDYLIYVRAGANSPDARLQEQLDLRIRVETPTVWGAVGIVIVAAVIAALAVMFRRLGRR
jgi:uncharacterized membrane protein